MTTATSRRKKERNSASSSSNQPPELVALARIDFTTYWQASTGFTPAQHQERICQEVQAFLEDCWSRPAHEHDTLRVLVINLPPGAGKSTITSGKLPSWILGTRPHERIGLVSAKGDLADLFELVTKSDIEQGDLYQACFPTDAAKPDKTRAWARGKLFVQGLPRQEITPSISASGLFGSILGKRFSTIILDDPQDQESAATPEMRDKTWRFIDGTVLSRGIPGCPVILIQQRLHEDDVSGRMIQHYQPHVIEIPALNPDGTSYWPGRYSAKFLEQKRRADPHLFEAWYQQNPGKGDGDIFKREHFRTYEGQPPAGQRIQSWDTAQKANQRNDLTAFVDAIITPTSDVYLVDFDWRRVEFPALIQWMQATANAARPHLVLVEDKSSGTSAIQVLRETTSLPIEGVMPETDKIARARGSTGWLSAGKIYFPAHHPKIAEFQQFLLGFPLATHDDPVDAFTQLIAYTVANAWTELTPEDENTLTGW